MPKAVRASAKPAPILVAIDEGGIVRINLRVSSRKGSGDSILWIALSDDTWTINFTNGNPMLDKTHPIRTDGTPRLIDPTAYPPVGSGEAFKFKYQILDENGDVTDDPDVLLED